MSSVKKITKSPKAKAAQTKAESAKSAAGRGRTAKRGAEPSQKKARATASRATSARPKTATATKHTAAQKTKAVVKPARTSAARAGKANVVKANTAKARSAAKASTVKARGVKTGRVRTEKAKAAPKVKPAAKAAVRKTTRGTTKAAPAQKMASAKRKTSPVRGAQTKQVKATTLAKTKAGVTAAPRMVPAKTSIATESRRSKTTSREAARGEAATREQIAAVAKKAATKLAAHPEVRLALRPLAERLPAAQPTKGQAVIKTQAVTKTIGAQEHQTVIQKLPKKTVAAPVANSTVPAATKGGTVQMEAEKLPAERPQIQKLMAASNKPQPVIEEVKGPEVKAAEAKNVETKMVDKATPVAKSTKAAAPKQGFKPSEYIVYPAHGVGQIATVEEQEVAGFKLELYVISFIKDKMILKVPVPKSASVGMRKLAGPDVVKRALATLTGRARIKRTMWSRRAQEYEAKINSGDLVAIAEVVRDLYRSDAQPEQSYSERQLYEAALDRVAREIAVVHKLTETESLKLIESQLQKGPRRGKGEDADTVTAEGEDGDIDEAA